jgi:hypothetical protein
MTVKTVDLIEFAERVERVCDFFLSRVGKDGSNDVKVLEQLKETAADLATGTAVPDNAQGSLTGLFEYMSGN